MEPNENKQPPTDAQVEQEKLEQERQAALEREEAAAK